MAAVPCSSESTKIFLDTVFTSYGKVKKYEDDHALLY